MIRRSFFTLITLTFTLTSTSASGQRVEGPERLAWLDAETGSLAAIRLFDLAEQEFGPLERLALRTLKLTSRDAVDALRLDLPQQDDSIAAVPSIRLPDGGRLVRHEAPGRGVGGIVHLDAWGHALVLLELPRIAGRHPLSRWIAVSPFEPVAAVITNEDASDRGDVYLLRFDGERFARSGTPSLRVTGALPGADADVRSLAFAREALFFVQDEEQLFRVPSDGATDAVAITMPLSGGRVPAEFSEEIAVSANGETIALLAGESEQSWDLYVGTASGVMRNLTRGPAEYQPVGHLPKKNGPTLALSPDGGHITYGCECPDLELFHRTTDGAGVVIPLSTDSWFEPSIDDGSTIISGGLSVQLTFGEDATHKDVYRITLGTDRVLEAQNLTGTSGDLVAPFDTGATLRPVAAACDQAGVMVLLDDRSATQGRPSFDLWTSDVRGARRQIVDAPEPPTWMTPTGKAFTRFICWSDRAGASFVAEHAGGGATPFKVLLQGPPGVSIRGLSVRADGGDLALIASAGAGLEVVAAYDRPSGVVRLLTPRPGFAGPATSYARTGEVVFSFGFTPARLAAVERPIGSSSTRVLPLAPGDWLRLDR